MFLFRFTSTKGKRIFEGSCTNLAVKLLPILLPTASLLAIPPKDSLPASLFMLPPLDTYHLESLALACACFLLACDIALSSRSFILMKEVR